MAPRSKTSHGKGCKCPVCEIVDQFGVKYSRENCDKGNAVVPYLPPIMLDDDGNVVEFEYLSPHEAAEAGFCRNNQAGGHPVIKFPPTPPSPITNCVNIPDRDADAWPKKANGQPKPFFQLFCLPDGSGIVPREFTAPNGAGQANGRKWRPLLVNDDCVAGVWTSPIVCGAAVGQVESGDADGEQVNKPLSGDDGDDTIHDDLVCVVAEYTNDSNCVMRLEFQSSQTMTIEIDPGSFIQVGHDIQGGFGAAGDQFDSGSSQTPGWYNKTDEVVCMTYTTLHNNCICLGPGQTATYKSVPKTRTKQDGSTGTLISYQSRSRVCWETV